ncbi:MAG: NAD(P)-dependent oxidoreductase [Burkholderiales bacterium]|nr:NAD(P)-dependent oxidoreductase [Burkholderiales bacterium]
MRKVVVTGGSGRVGRYVLRELAPHFDVLNADLAAAPVDTRYRCTDVMKLDEVRAAVQGADAVIHLAAIDYDHKAAPERYIDVNIRGSWHVLQAAAEAGVKKVVLCSSISTCGLSEMRPDWRPKSLQVDERHENRPVQAYSVSKQAIEQMGLAFVHGSAMDVVCLRPLAVVMRESFGGFLEFIDEPSRNWLFYYVSAEDVARGFRLALETAGPRYGVYFLSAADTCRPEPTLEWYRDRLGELPEIPVPRLFARQPRASIFSSAAARDVLGWEPSTDFQQLRREWR